VWGLAIPKNGGEKNYLEYLLRRPKFLVTCAYASNAILLGWASGNSIVFGEYILRAANQENPGQWTRRLIGFACITFAFLLHGTRVKWGLWLQNVLGTIKIFIVLIIIVAGFVALGGHLKVPKPNNFDHAFAGTTASASSFCLSLYNVIWSYVGFSNVNYVSSPRNTGGVKDVHRTLRCRRWFFGQCGALSNFQHLAALAHSGPHFTPKPQSRP
jgi:amino acid transporter